MKTVKINHEHGSVNIHSRPMDASWVIRPDAYLVGGFNPSEKYESKWVHLPQFSG